MDLLEFREYCLSFEGVTEKTPFGKFAKRYESMLAFYVAGHIFCLTDIDDFTYVNIRTTPEQAGELLDSYSDVTKPINQSLRYWVQIELGGDVPEEIILRLVRESYDIVKVRYSKANK